MISCSMIPSWKRDIVSQERVEETGRRLKKREKEWSGRSQERSLPSPDELDKQLQQKKKRAEGPLTLPENVPAQMDEDEDDNDGLTDPPSLLPSISYGSDMKQQT